ncbi:MULTISPECIES: flagellar hook-basal body complex protein [Dethiosulfovibrio]|uniref:Flagellar hook protein FlgE n=2 Tax=Dethiosulfovibrio TaxID=47054 RepID=A0ABS9EK69_9BACT|nr:MULTISPECIES: flagellar hook-basal body complex protein [Dethiosulfovibrio]MCF4113988.1 flagellar hook-basal body complex protein [Dethiosulfovibrio russensis]MCF4141599.1 flagellar hook-basal body complex protein [Dethiosulfovibrio marinus]MCF4143984.1 flagellar hook-basal body complex protein [Dethiosulfovibrio acidaminovorans]
MLRSLLTGVSGAKAHQKRLDVVGNNIANVNTVGFKKSTVVFQDLLSQTERGAMAPDGNVGGVNAKQVGLGVQVGAIETIHTQGTVSQTGNRTDMAIQGEGYYVVRNGAENLYTRAGQFVLDSNSDLAMSGTGYRVQGNEMTVDEDGVISTGSELSDINIPIGRKMEAKATSTVGYRCNLDSRVDPYLPLGIPDGVKFSSEILGSEYTISVAEGEDVSDFINIRLENEADGSVETLRFSFEGVQQSSHDESTYYPKLELVGSSGHTVNYDAAKGELSIDGTSIPMSAYMNYQAVSIEDSTGTTHTYLAEITEIGNKAQVRLWGEGKNESTGASQVDYFQWNVLKTEDGLFDPDSTLKMTTGEDSEFPDPVSLFLEIDSSGKALNFRGNVSPIIGPATSNSGVNKEGDTTVTPAYTVTSTDGTSATADITYRFQEGTTISDFITLDLADSGIGVGGTINLAFKGVSEDGNVILQPSPSTVSLSASDPDDDTAVIAQDHEVVYNPEKGTLSLVNEDTGKTTWTYSDFNFQTTEINGAQYLVDYSSSDGTVGNYGDTVTLWGPNDMGVMTAFNMDLTAGDVTFNSGTSEYSSASGAGATFASSFAGGAKVTVKPSPTDPSKLIFTYDGTDGGKPVSSIREGSDSVHEGKGTVYDSLGNEHTLEVVWKKVGSNAWSWEAFLPDEPELKLSDNKGVIRFSSEGKLLSGGENTISIGFSAIGADDADVVLDFSGKSFDKEEIEGVTQYGSAFTTKPYTQNGYSMGVLEDFSVSNDGTIIGIYDNGQNRGLYKMALAMFANPQGLVKTGNTCFSKSINSGEPSIVNAMVEGAGTIAGSSLEYSNVDITDEFTDLITTQRGFQASARVITTSDSVLEELLNLKR